MTNYNERLDEILLSHGAEQGEFHYSLKQAITSLIKELVAEAKPKCPVGNCNDGHLMEQDPEGDWSDYAECEFCHLSREYYNNLLKALEEV